MLDKLQSLEDKYHEISNLLSDPAILADQAQYQKHAKAHSGLIDIVTLYQEYKKLLQNKADALSLLEVETDAEMISMYKAELKELEDSVPRIEERLRILLLPKDPNDDKNVIVEIRGGAGGDEAALFAGELSRMYARYAERTGWKMEVIEAHATDIGGYKEIIFEIDGQGAYSRLKYESGVHRVQRIPSTESGGRIHTSTVTVAVLPEAEEVDVQINANDLKIDVFCAGGPGGQCVNTTQSAVRITHLPTGIAVSMQDEKSQHKNKDKALKILRSRLLEKAQSEAHGEMADLRKSQVGTGDRSERIRTYNYPQNRVTDHRIGLSLHKLDLVVDGDLNELIDALTTSDQAEKLKQVE
jgi:peptide chain release factor 1